MLKLFVFSFFLLQALTCCNVCIPMEVSIVNWASDNRLAIAEAHQRFDNNLSPPGQALD